MELEAGRAIANGAGCIVVSVDYRVGGPSASGNLAAVALMARDRGYAACSLRHTYILLTQHEGDTGSLSALIGAAHTVTVSLPRVRAGMEKAT